VGCCTIAGLLAFSSVEIDRPPEITLRITFGINDKEPTDWSATLEAADGDIVSISGWRFEDRDKVLDKTGWRGETHSFTPGRRRARAAQRPQRAGDFEMWPNGVAVVVRGAKPALTIHFAQGDVRFQVSDVPLGAPKTFLNGQVRVDRLPPTSLLRPAPPGSSENARQDDYPAFCISRKTGTHFLAWICYHQRADRVLLTQRSGSDDPWSDPIPVSEPGDHFRVALAEGGDGTLWIVWSAQRDGNWDLFGRPLVQGKLGDQTRLTEAAGPDLWHRMTTDSRGRCWLVWQGFRAGQSDIFARCADSAGWHPPIRISTGGADDWDPAVAADPKEDRIWVGWDSYETGHYDVRVRSLSGGPNPALCDVLVPGRGDRFRAHVSLACDHSGRLWCAWDESGAQWGKDTGFFYQKTGAVRPYQVRRIEVKCLTDGKWQTPAPDLASFIPGDMKDYYELPQLQEDNAGRMWMAFRHRTTRLQRADGWANQGRWDVFATAYLGDRWLVPTELPDSAGRNDMRIASDRDAAGPAFFAYASDNRAWATPQMAPRNLSISVARLGSTLKAFDGQFAADDRAENEPSVKVVHPRENEQVARMRHYTTRARGKTLHVYRGDLHRHTDISIDGIGDGSLMDLYRYGLDAAALDFILVSDHNMGHDNEYSWWRTQKSNDLYCLAGSFVPLYGYERSVPYPQGHRNVIWAERGHRTLPLPIMANQEQRAKDTANVYAYLQETNGICTSHTSATNQGTDWQGHNDRLEPFVEIFQGFHASYEAPGAPKAPDASTREVHGPLKPEGFVSNALRKGYKLGFQASSDHVSGHVSYACVWAEELSRKGLMDAMRKRHTYGATDNLVLDMRMGTLGMMGDQVRTVKPELDVVALGTGPIDRVDVLRDSEVVESVRPDKNPEEVRFHWEDPSPIRRQGPVYYYVRVVQVDGQLAWASPIWVYPDN
jgi:hypothetical protein